MLAVNFLRLLEGAAAIRIHHRQQKEAAFASRTTPFQHHSHFTSTAAAAVVATQVLTEIRSSLLSKNQDLGLPLNVEDAAAFYYNDIHSTREIWSEVNLLLLPGAKVMLRLHLFDLMNKLAMYEQM